MLLMENKKYPHPLNAVKLARLAVDRSSQGQIIPFYQQYDFLFAKPNELPCLEMWLPIKTCLEVVSSLL